METFSTSEVAKQVGISSVTLDRWIGNGEVPAPMTIFVGRKLVRRWTVQDVERVLTFKLQSYGKIRRPRNR
jgi:excisionase family DNA binding protein